MQVTKDTGMRLPQRWASSYNRVACLYIIPTKILSISMTVAMQGKFYQYKDNKGTNWPLYGNMQVMLSLGEGAFHPMCVFDLNIVHHPSDSIGHGVTSFQKYSLKKRAMARPSGIMQIVVPIIPNRNAQKGTLGNTV